jgi:HlyD family secretion protein
MKRRHSSLLLAASFTTVVSLQCGTATTNGALVASGHVEATDVRIATKIGGRVVSVEKQEGDVVKTGDLLARVSTTDLELQVRQAQAERGQAAAELKLRLAGPRAQERAEAEAQVRAVEAELKGAELDLERMQGLLDRGSGVAKARDDARTRRDVLKNRLEALRQTADRLNSGSRGEEIEAARARTQAIDARIALLQQQIDDATITSPTDGVVTSRIAEPGELLATGAPICVVTRLSDAWLTVYAPEPDLGRIRIGQEVDVTTDGGLSRKGRVTTIASKAEFTPRNVQTRDERVKLVYRVKIALENADGAFKPGMPAEARFSEGGAR